MKQYLSFSEYYLYNRDKKTYHRKYILGEEIPPTREQILGKIVHKALEDERYEWLKDLKENGFTKRKQVRKLLDKMANKRPPEVEVGMRAVTKSKVKLFGIWDGFDKKNRELIEYKTTTGDEFWSQQIVDYHQQLSFYAYMYWLTYFSFFKEIRVYVLNIEKATVKTYKTVRGRRDILDIRNRIDRTVESMVADNFWYKRLSNKDRYNQKLNI